MALLIVSPIKIKQLKYGGVNKSPLGEWGNRYKAAVALIMACTRGCTHRKGKGRPKGLCVNTPRVWFLTPCKFTHQITAPLVNCKWTVVTRKSVGASAQCWRGATNCLCLGEGNETSAELLSCSPSWILALQITKQLHSLCVRKK